MTLEKQLKMADPRVQREQKELINDLQNKVKILEKELALVHEGSKKEVDKYKKEADAIIGQKLEDDFN
jgi:hypothetical protein